MKKLFRFGIVSLALAMCFGTGALASKAQRDISIAKADDGGLEFVMANDSTCSDTTYYSQSGSDSQNLPWSTLNKNNTANFTLPGSVTNNYTVSENSANKLYNYCYRPFFIYPRLKGTGYMEAKKQYVINVTFTLSLTKAANAGAAYAHAELFLLENGNNKPVPSLYNSRFETPTDHNLEESNGYNNCTTDAYSIGCYTQKVNKAITQSVTKTITFENETTSQQVVRYQLGLFVGCNYASSKEHTTSATVSYTINSVTKTDLVAAIGNKGYTSFDNALTAATSGSTINVLNNCSSSLYSVASTEGLSKNLTLNLNGFTISMANYDNFLAVKANYSLTINGGGGTIRNINMANANSNPVLQVSNNATLTLSNVTINKSDGANAAINVYGNLVADSSVTITTNSNYSNGYALLVSGSSATAVLNGSTVSSYVETIYVKWGATARLNAATVSSSGNNAIFVEGGNYNNKLYLYGAVTLSSGRTGGTGAGHVWLESNGSQNIIYANYSSTYLTKAVTVWVSGSNYTEGTTIVSGDKNSKISFTQLIVGTGLTTTRSGYDVVVVKQTLTVSFNKNGGTGTMNSQNIQYNNSLNLPPCAFTAPAYHTFRYWNTEPNGTGTTRYPDQSYVVIENVTFYAIWYQTDTNIYDEFRLEYLKMESYTSELGYCKDSTHHYYADAKDYFENSMTKNQRVSFASNYVDEWDRFRAWAAANGETIVLESGDYVIQSSNAGTSFVPADNNNMIILIAAISVMVSSIGFAILILVKKRYSHK